MRLDIHRRRNSVGYGRRGHQSFDSMDDLLHKERNGKYLNPVEKAELKKYAEKQRKKKMAQKH